MQSRLGGESWAQWRTRFGPPSRDGRAAKRLSRSARNSCVHKETAHTTGTGQNSLDYRVTRTQLRRNAPRTPSLFTRSATAADRRGDPGDTPVGTVTEALLQASVIIDPDAQRRAIVAIVETLCANAYATPAAETRELFPELHTTLLASDPERARLSQRRCCRSTRGIRTIPIFPISVICSPHSLVAGSRAILSEPRQEE